MRVVGVDLGVSSGAVVLVEFNDAGLVVSAETLHLLQRKRKTKAPKTPPELATVAAGYTRALPILPAETVVAIDWDPRDAFWGNRTASVQKAFIAGSLFTKLLLSDYHPMCIPPDQVRAFTGLTSKAPKEDTHLFLSRVFLHRGLAIIPRSEHEDDAILLACVARKIALGG